SYPRTIRRFANCSGPRNRSPANCRSMPKNLPPVTRGKQPITRLRRSLVVGKRFERFGSLIGVISLSCAVLLGSPSAVRAEQQVRLQSGLVIRGSVIEMASLNQNAFSAASAGGEVRLMPIWMIDDGLRRT